MYVSDFLCTFENPTPLFWEKRGNGWINANVSKIVLSMNFNNLKKKIFKLINFKKILIT